MMDNYLQRFKILQSELYEKKVLYADSMKNDIQFEDMKKLYMEIKELTRKIEALLTERTKVPDIKLYQ